VRAGLASLVLLAGAMLVAPSLAAEEVCRAAEDAETVPGPENENNHGPAYAVVTQNLDWDTSAALDCRP
jgi:hypothetical protein